MYYIGKLNKINIKDYSNRITNDDIVITDERKKHIYQNHKNDFKIIMENINKVVLNPNEIIEDLKNKDTLFFIGKLDKNNLNVVVRLNTTNDIKHPYNSVMTAWIIRDCNLKKLREKNKSIYKDE